MSSFNMLSVLHDKLKTYTKISIVAVSVLLIAFVAGFVYKNQFVGAASEQTCIMNGVTAKWISDNDDDVICGDTFNTIENYGASEVTLTGEATDEVAFLNFYLDMTTINLNNVTENNPSGKDYCISGSGCVSLDVGNTNNNNEVTVNLTGENQLLILQFYIINKVNIVGPGSLTTFGIVNHQGELNLNADMMLNKSDSLVSVLRADTKMNFLSGNITINGAGSVEDKDHDDDIFVEANDIYISNNANVQFNVSSLIGSVGNVYALYFSNSFTLGDKIVSKRDGMPIANTNDINSYLINTGDSTIITFGVPLPNPNPNPDGDLTPPNTGFGL